jgi:hypothetical protein
MEFFHGVFHPGYSTSKNGDGCALAEPLISSPTDWMDSGKSLSFDING